MLHCIEFRFQALHRMALRCAALHCIALRFIALMSSIALRCVALHCIAMQLCFLEFFALPCLALHFTLFDGIALHCIAFHCIVLHCVVMRCIALQCNMVQCVAFNSFALNCPLRWPTFVSVLMAKFLGEGARWTEWHFVPHLSGARETCSKGKDSCPCWRSSRAVFGGDRLFLEINRRSAFESIASCVHP